MLHSIELKIPPPIVALVVAFAMWTIARGHAASHTMDAVRTLGAIAIVLVGAGFDAAALIAFHRARTTINPLRPQSASSLVTSGVYRITRNPMYVGLVLFLCAWAAWLGSWPAW